MSSEGYLRHILQQVATAEVVEGEQKGSVAPAPTLVRTTSEGAFLKGETGGPDIVEASR